jgi:hypothetical protein
MQYRPSHRSPRWLLASAIVALGAMLAWPAGAQDTFMQTDRMRTGAKLTISGHINKAVMFADDGRTSRTLIVDNNASTTRLNLSAEAPITEDFEFGAQIELEIPSNSGGVVTIHQGNGDNNQNFSRFVERKIEVMATHKRLGKIWLGQGSTATDEIVESDLSGAAMTGNYGDAGVLGSAFVFYNTRTRSWDGPTVGDVVVSLNGGMDDRIRYDTPTYGGFFASAAFVSGGQADMALRYADKIGPFELVAALGYSNLNGINNTIDNRIVGSAAVLHESGVNVAVAAGRQEHKAANRNDGTSYYGKVGYIAKLFDLGPTAFAVDYGVYDNYGQNGDEAKQYSIAVVQHFERIGSQVYVLGKTYELDRAGAS